MTEVCLDRHIVLTNSLFLNCIAGFNHHHIIGREITSLLERNYRLTTVELLTLSMKSSNCYHYISMLLPRAY